MQRPPASDDVKMPLFNNEKLLDIVTQRLVQTRTAPSLARGDSDIFWQTMGDDLLKQLSGKASSTNADTNLQYTALQRRIGADSTVPEHAIPRVRIGLGSFYLTAEPHSAAASAAFPTGPIGIAVYEDFLIRYGLKCRRALAVKQLPDGTGHPTDVNAARMYFEAANALTSKYGRTGGAAALNASSAAAMAMLSSGKTEPSPPRPQSSAALHQRPASSSFRINIGAMPLRPSSRAGSSHGARPTSSSNINTNSGRCILDDLPTLRQALCRKFVQTVVEVIGEAGADPSNAVEIVLHPKIGTLKIRQKVVSLTMASTGEEAGGDPAGLGTNAIPIPSRRKYQEREEALTIAFGDGEDINDCDEHFIEDGEGVGVGGDTTMAAAAAAENGGGKLRRAKAPMSNKMKLILQKREADKHGKDYVAPISDIDSCFSSPSMNARRKVLNDSHVMLKKPSPSGDDEDMTLNDTSIGGGNKVETVRNLKITNKFEPKIDLSTYRPSSSASVRIGGGGGRSSTHNGLNRLNHNNVVVLSQLDAKLAHLRSQLADPLDEIEENMYGDYRPPPTPYGSGGGGLESPAAIHDRRRKEDDYYATKGGRGSYNDQHDEKKQRGEPIVVEVGEDGLPILPTVRGAAAATSKKNAARTNPILGFDPLQRGASSGNRTMSSAASSSSSFNHHRRPPLIPADKVDLGNTALVNGHIVYGKNKKLHSLSEQDVPTIDDALQRRTEKAAAQRSHGTVLKQQSKYKHDVKVKEAAQALVIQQKETEVQVLSEALAIIDKMKKKREALGGAAGAE